MDDFSTFCVRQPPLESSQKLDPLAEDVNGSSSQQKQERLEEMWCEWFEPKAPARACWNGMYVRHAQGPYKQLSIVRIVPTFHQCCPAPTQALNCERCVSLEYDDYSQAWIRKLYKAFKESEDANLFVLGLTLWGVQSMT